MGKDKLKNVWKRINVKQVEPRVTWTSVGLPSMDPANPNNKLGRTFNLMQTLNKKK